MKTALETEFSQRLVKLSSGQSGLRAQLQVKASVPSDADGDCIDMKASDETMDRYEEIIKADGWELGNYQKNPVIQNCHQYGNILHTLGKALTTEVKDGALVQRWKFATSENPLAKIAFGLYKGGYLNASSVGFIPLEWINGNKAGDPCRTYTKCELLEVSAVGIPANPNALTLGLKSGVIEKSDLKELADILKQFCEEQADSPTDTRSMGGGIDVEQLSQITPLIKTCSDLIRA